MSKWNDARYSNDDLADILSDYHKDVHGFRLHMAGSARADLVAELDRLDQYVEADSTFLFTDKNIQQLYEDQEYTDWSTELDQQFYQTL